MDDDIEMSIEFGDGSSPVEFPDEGITVSLAVTEVGPSLYRLDNIPTMVEHAQYRDVVEAKRLASGVLRVVRVAERSDWTTFDFILPTKMFESDELSRILLHVETLGGYWERVMGGMLFICVPPGLDYDPTQQIMGWPGT